MSEKDNVVVEKSYAFALDVVKVSLTLKQNRLHYELASQLLRSGTSIGANIAEAQYAQSDKDFASKLQIALKEASETVYWLRLLKDAEILDCDTAKALFNKATELRRILVSITKSLKTKND